MIRHKALIFASLVFCVFACAQQPAESKIKEETTRFWLVSVPADSQLNQNHPLMTYMKAAAARELPLRFFRELIEENASVTVTEGSWPTYQPGYFSGGTIYMPSSASASSWTRMQWSSFYNELFHAWFGNIFTKLPRYQATRNLIWTAERFAHYSKANPSDPKLAQEEAWSETVMTLMIDLSPTRLPEGSINYPKLESFVYSIGRTVAPVSHSERPGYTPEAETTYPAPWEYDILFQILTMIPAPH
jgi:hypothetical protein